MVRYMDPHVVGHMRVGYSRIGVLNPLFERAMTRSLGKTVEIIRRIRSVSTLTFDSVTGWPKVSWDEFPINAILNFGPSSKQDLPPGIVGNLDGIVIVVDALRFKDQFIYPADGGDYYEVNSPLEERRGVNGGFLFRRAAFRKLDLLAT